MVRQIKQIKELKSGVFSQDLLLLILGIIVGLIVPFMVWLWISLKLSDFFLDLIV